MLHTKSIKTGQCFSVTKLFLKSGMHFLRHSVYRVAVLTNLNTRVFLVHVPYKHRKSKSDVNVPQSRSIWHANFQLNKSKDRSG